MHKACGCLCMIDEAIRTVKQNLPGYGTDEGLGRRKGEVGLPRYLAAWLRQLQSGWHWGEERMGRRRMPALGTSGSMKVTTRRHYE
jgi:hypothetical protein